MSILIKELHLPAERLYPLHLTIYSDGSVFCGHGIGKRSYKAVEVPVPHGRLGDLDALAQLFKEKATEHGGIGGIMVAMAAGCIDAAPTIIPADPPKEET